MLLLVKNNMGKSRVNRFTHRNTERFSTSYIVNNFILLSFISKLYPFLPFKLSLNKSFHFAKSIVRKSFIMIYFYSFYIELNLLNRSVFYETLSKKQKQFHHFCNYFKSLEIKTFLQNAIGALFLSPFTLITYAFILAYKVTFMNKSLIEALSSAVSLILIFWVVALYLMMFYVVYFKGKIHY